ncbi:hypothetical protein RAA17_10535 [Komagataeibacter rhaeticus]|nr:hypothetical protein [Komagataeibacter rhaeticus]
MRGYTFQGSIGRHARSDGADVPVTIMGFGEMLPYRDNAITLDPRRRDRWGVPLPHIRCVPHANERAMLRRQIRDCADMIEAHGGHVDFWASPLGLGKAMPDCILTSRSPYAGSYARCSPQHDNGRRHS